MHRITFILLTLTTAITFGCGKKADIKDYIPPQESAKQALTTALDAWKAGKGPDEIGASNPAISAQDIQWRSGKKLTAYEIVGPATGDDQNQRFTVKLTLDGGAPQEMIYVVYGKDPIWVNSEESYKKTSGM